MKGKLGTIALVLVAALGLGLLLYPSVSDWWNSTHQTRAVASYGGAVSSTDDAELDRIREEALAYNARLAEAGNSWFLSDEQMADYKSQMVVPGSDVMAYVEVPKINCTLPIYHGTDEAVLQVAVGHIEGSSLPVGGESSHCVVSGHRGLPSARLFTDLDQMELGDHFSMHVLGEELVYEVDQVLTVLPDETEALEVVEGEDYCTLVTCTPYGVNSHRLLVRGERVDASELSAADATSVTADAMVVDPMLVSLVLAAPMLLVVCVVSLVVWRRGR